MHIVGSVDKGVNNIDRVLKGIQLKGDYGLSVIDGNYVIDICEDMSHYHIAKKFDIDFFVDKILENLNEEEEYLSEYFESVKPVVTWEEYLSDEKIQKGLDLYLERVSKAFEPVYLRTVKEGSIKLCLWHPDMENY